MYACLHSSLWDAVCMWEGWERSLTCLISMRQKWISIGISDPAASVKVLPPMYSKKFSGENHHSYSDYLDYDERPHLLVGCPSSGPASVPYVFIWMKLASS